MKTLKKNLWIAAVVAMTTATASSLFGVVPILSVDENGHGSFLNQPLPFGVALNPPAGFATLVYDLPFAGTPGDVLLTEPGTGGLSDVIRFDGLGHLYFFSDREASDTPPFDLADTGLPSTFNANSVNMQEVGPEGNNGAIYTPLPGQPGFDAAVGGYQFISDVPEPSALALAGLGVGSLLALRRRQTC